MYLGNRKIKFADKKWEDGYKEFESSTHPEDKILYLFYEKIRKKTWEKQRSGKEITKDKIPAIYIKMFHIDNLWKLELKDVVVVSYSDVVYYSIVGEEILIIDINDTVLMLSESV